MVLFLQPKMAEKDNYTSGFELANESTSRNYDQSEIKNNT
jgi:hypothetical protein